MLSTNLKPSGTSRFATSPEGSQSLNKMLEEAKSLSDEISELQEVLLF